MKSFDANAWNYEQGIDEQIALVYALEARRQINATAAARILALRRLGGKAFGLALCEQIARAFNRPSDSLALSVPAWEPLSVRDLQTLGEGWQTERQEALFALLKKKSLGQDFLVRSSALLEDWGDPSSGQAESFSVTAERLLSAERREQLFKSLTMPVVVQEMASGQGVVIDLVWSELLRRVVARVAWGRQYLAGQSAGTSPTWDDEAPLAVFDPVSGVTILPFYSPVDSENKLSAEFAIALARRLYNVVRHWNWNFGLQFEFVIRSRYECRLVQVRPSPGLLRRTEPLVPPRGKLLCTSARVNQAFSVQAKIESLYHDDYSEFSEEGKRKQAAFLRQGAVADETRPFAGKIFLWREDPEKRRSDLVWEVGALGAEAQVGASVFCNSTHGYPFKIRTEERFWREQARQHGKFMGLHPVSYHGESVLSLRRTLSNHPGQVLLISDGIIGRIYLVD